MTTMTDVRDRISAYLEERGGFDSEPQPLILDSPGDRWGWMSLDEETMVIWEVFSGLLVTKSAPPSLNPILDADAPGLLARLGETLDRLGC